MALDERERGAANDQAHREIEELKFLVGTSCSRLINLLMDRTTPAATLTAEVSFMAERAGRLAELLEATQPGGSADATARGGDAATHGGDETAPE